MHSSEHSGSKSKGNLEETDRLPSTVSCRDGNASFQNAFWEQFNGPGIQSSEGRNLREVSGDEQNDATWDAKRYLEELNSLRSRISPRCSRW